MSYKQEAIKDIFTKLGRKAFGIWFSGKSGKGEFMGWFPSGKIFEHSFWRNSKMHGEYKEWYDNGQVWENSLWENGRKVKDI